MDESANGQGPKVAKLELCNMEDLMGYISVHDRGRLRRLLEDRKTGALCSGHYGPPFTTEAFDGRDKSKAFRSIGYNRAVRDVKMLERVLEAHDHD